MPKQKGHPPFGDTELLYRRLIAAWAREDGSVDPGAIDLEGCSVDRGSMTTAEQALARCDLGEVAVASVAFKNLPDRFDLPPDSGQRDPPTPYELLVAYLPEFPDRLAHSHIEFWPEGGDSARKPKGGRMKAYIRDVVASRMRVALRRDGVE